ncbi:SIMPL domain-containing protein [Namhaeicola litoreus]|uniref:SIMPL domain-containing protein n=1 Tax=Namhaeicola litoreus TaxID=1052145 RepID=A0ABW3Y0Y4_9FLAO
MEKFDWFKILILSVAIVLAGYFVGNMHKTGKAFDRSVQVKGLAEKEVKADLAVWPINITLAGNDLLTLKNDLEMQNRAVKAFFLKLGFTEDELTSGNITITDTQAVLYGSENRNREYRYIANAEFTVRTKNIEKVQQALTGSLALISNGILINSKNSWQPIEYSYSGLNEIKPAMIEEATRNAREVADKFAEDSNSKVGKIKNAQQGLFTINNLDENTAYIKVVRVVSTIDYYLED